MRIFHFRILMDEVPDVFRDIEIAEDATFLEFHHSILKAFSFSGNEMASFYASDADWDKGEEISLMDMMSDLNSEPIKSMSETRLNEMLNEEGSKMLYLYDFMRMWIFYVELISIGEARADATYPEVVLLVGNAPAEDSKEEAGLMQIDIHEGDTLFDPDYDMNSDDGGFEPLDDSYEF